MTNEEKQLLLIDLCARLPYGLVCKVEFKDSEVWKKQDMLLEGVFTYQCYFESKTGSIYSREFKPYLRPMSSMTKKEKKDYNSKFEGRELSWEVYYGSTDWLNAHHLDYRGLIEKGLVLEAPEGMYK